MTWNKHENACWRGRVSRREKLIFLIGVIVGMLLVTIAHHIATSPHLW